MNIVHWRRRRRRRRNGATLIELMVTATLLASGVGIVAPLSVRCGRLWQQTRHHQLALDELSNQMDRLTRLPAGEIATALDSIEVSQAAQTMLAEVAMEGRILRATSEARLQLSIDWKRRGNPPPLTLVGWIESEDPE